MRGLFPRSEKAASPTWPSLASGAIGWRSRWVGTELHPWCCKSSWLHSPASGILPRQVNAVCAFPLQVCFLILYCVLPLCLWWMSSRGFYETLRMTFKKICLRENFRNYKVILVILPRSKNVRLEMLGSKEYDKGKSEFYRLQLSLEQTCSKSF